jgi:hypothetical protein
MLREQVAHAVASAIRFVVVTVIWQFVLFNLGRMTLLLLTFGRYPRHRDLRLRVNSITFVGLVVLLVLWSAIAVYNNLHPLHLYTP